MTRADRPAGRRRPAPGPTHGQPAPEVHAHVRLPHAHPAQKAQQECAGRPATCLRLNAPPTFVLGARCTQRCNIHNSPFEQRLIIEQLAPFRPLFCFLLFPAFLSFALFSHVRLQSATSARFSFVANNCRLFRTAPPLLPNFNLRITHHNQPIPAPCSEWTSSPFFFFRSVA